MKNSTGVQLTLAAALLMGAAGAHAGALDMVELARDKLYELRTGRARAGAPQPALGASDDWGAPSKPQAVLDADARRQDERYRDDRQSAVRAPVATAPAAAPRQADKARFSQSTSTAARLREPSRKTSGSEPGAGFSAQDCVSPNRVWEGAAALAQRGREDKAYAAYLALFLTCTRADDLEGTAYQAGQNLSAEHIDALLDEPALASPRLAAASYKLRVQRMFAANKARDFERALELARGLRESLLAQGGSGELEVAGWLEQQARRPREAETLFRAALKRQRDNDSARQGLVYALLAQKKVDAAAREADRYEGAGADELIAEVHLARSRESLALQDYDAALKWLDKAERSGIDVDASVMETRAWALKGAGKAAEAARIFAQLTAEQPKDANLRKGLLQALAASGDAEKLTRLTAEPGPVGEEARAALADVYQSQGRTTAAAELRGERAQERVPQANAAVAVRSKSGDKGEGRLVEIVQPVVGFSAPLGTVSKVSIEAKQLHLNDGEHSANGTEVRLRATTEVQGTEVTAGIGASKTGSSLKPTFELSVKRHTKSGQLEAGISHEPVRDSVRAYSGVRMDVTESMPDGSQRRVTRSVGRVFDTNARVGGQVTVSEQQGLKLSWNLTAGSMKGDGTSNNGYVGATAGLAKDFAQDGFSWLSAGPYITVTSFERDENQFGAGHGGYFSPKSDVGMGLALNAMTDEGNSSLYKVSAKAGYVSRGLYYGNDSGLSLELDSAGAWLVAPNVIVGAGLGLKASPGYTDVGLRVGISVPLEARTKLGASDLSAYKSQP